MVSRVNIFLSRQLFRLENKIKRLFIDQEQSSAVRRNIRPSRIRPKIRKNVL